MKRIDCMEILVSDQMTIGSLLHYNSKEDKIIGLHDEGSGKRRPGPACLNKCHSIELQVVALTTICDQGGTNQAAINSILKEKREIFARKNEENKYLGFFVNGQEIIPLFDTPHLFKESQVNFDADGIHTANLTLFLDKLFDSVNSSRKTAPRGKPLKSGVQHGSIHFQFWHEPVQILETTKLLCPNLTA
ncbi:hypothetical protein ILUMI_19885 [Ignelater luminosus]|uniref:Uncharacterized protein n=1 Tax=Ignelater luminosus TaxID=2038154 RepID=A0A8K0FZG2_IGNLU|nr:hypothetical protein ILUMI_19885 [Ignelater luminosus]